MASILLKSDSQYPVKEATVKQSRSPIAALICVRATTRLKPCLFRLGQDPDLDIAE